MKPLAQQRQSIRHLLNERIPLDGIASYFAFDHADNRTQIVTYPVDNHPMGFVTLSRTGIDLFRPFVTLRFPPNDMEGSVDLLYASLMPETAVILNVLASDLPLLRAFFDIQTEELLNILALDPQQYEPVINVLVSQTASNNAYPRFIIRSNQTGENEIAASAGINWQTDHFAEIAVTTSQRHRRQGLGRSVVSSAVNYVLENGRIPLYAVSENNAASMQLAQNLGFFDSVARHALLQATLRPRP